MLARLTPMFFDAAVDPIVTDKTPAPGKDILTGQRQQPLLRRHRSSRPSRAGLEKNGLNSRLVKQNGKLVEEVYKVGGRYSKEITEIVTHLEAAIPFATEPMAAALRALMQFYRTGENADREKYDIAWVNDKARRSTPSTASSRSISTRAASRAAGKGWSST